MSADQAQRLLVREVGDIRHNSLSLIFVVESLLHNLDAFELQKSLDFVSRVGVDSEDFPALKAGGRPGLPDHYDIVSKLIF